MCLKRSRLVLGAALIGIACGGETVGDRFETAGGSGGANSGGASGKGGSGSGGSPGAGGGVIAGGAGVAASGAVAGVAGVPIGGAGGGAAVGGVGAGGFGAGGAGGGVSGGGGAGADVCAAVLEEYEKLAALARQCNPFVDAVQCQFVAAGICCPISVNDSASAEKLGALVEYARQVCGNWGCPELLCQPAPSFNCMPLSGVAPGMCM